MNRAVSFFFKGLEGLLVLLLAAMVAEPISPGAAEELAGQALTGARAAPGVRYACVNALVQLAFWRNDRQRMEFLLQVVSAARHIGILWSAANPAAAFDFENTREAVMAAGLTSLSLPVVAGELMLGSWQQVVAINLDNRPRERELVAVLVGS